jgi:hypothetical protein
MDSLIRLTETVITEYNIGQRSYGVLYQSITGFDYFGGSVFKSVFNRINTCSGLGQVFNRFSGVFVPYEVLAEL